MARRGGRAWGDPEISGEVLSSILAAPESFLWSNLHRPVKLDMGSLVVEAELPTNRGPVHVFFKRYRATKWWKKLLSNVRRSRSMRVWRQGRAMRERGIATPQPVLACEVRAGWQRYGYLAVRWVEGAENLYGYGLKLSARAPCERMRRAHACAECLGRLLGRMHSERMIHGDLKATNILIAARETGLEMWLVDLDAARFVRRATPPRRAADLARLALSMYRFPWVSRTVACRFFRAYAAQCGGTRTEWKQLWRAIEYHRRRIFEKKCRRGEEIW